MKVKPLKPHPCGIGLIQCSAEEATFVELNMPCDMPYRLIPVRGTNNWTWNGDTEKPTLKPSILTTRYDGKRCHSFVGDGNVQFLADCSHEFAGQTLPLLDV